MLRLPETQNGAPWLKRRRLQELIVSNLAMSEATVKLLIEKDVFTEAEFQAKLETE
jgi:hypothetical protein